MQPIPKDQIIQRLTADNPWWTDPSNLGGAMQGLQPRAYFHLFGSLVLEHAVRRAVILMGPRRVGKTVMIHHMIKALLDQGVLPVNICYLSVDHPLYTGCGLEQLLRYYVEASGIDADTERAYVFFDEIQYLKTWEVHLKALVDRYPNLKFIASGSAAAALRLKSTESGAGRFTEFLLPPLTFHEYLELIGAGDVAELPQEIGFATARDIEQCNAYFVDYLNFGGYPEVVLSEAVRADPMRFVKNDIVDKVLLRDLPGLYGIQDVQELNSLFTTIAFNTAQEISPDTLAKHSGVAKNTISRYLEYLEAAFLIKRVHRVDRNARRFQRMTAFKVYLTNPSIRSALFAPLSDTSEEIGSLAETGIFSQWFHQPVQLYYARWPEGEVDMVQLDANQRPRWTVEVKWSNRFAEHPNELTALLKFCETNSLPRALVTTRTLTREVVMHSGLKLQFVPTSLYCYTIGRRLVESKHPAIGMP